MQTNIDNAVSLLFTLSCTLYYALSMKEIFFTVTFGFLSDHIFSYGVALRTFWSRTGVVFHSRDQSRDVCLIMRQ